MNAAKIENFVRILSEFKKEDDDPQALVEWVIDEARAVLKEEDRLVLDMSESSGCVVWFEGAKTAQNLMCSTSSLVGKRLSVKPGSMPGFPVFPYAAQSCLSSFGHRCRYSKGQSGEAPLIRGRPAGRGVHLIPGFGRQKGWRSVQPLR